MGSIKFASKLKNARINAGFTQKDMYERLGISQSTFSSWEVGKSEPSAEVLIKLCRWYGLNSLDYFCDDEMLNPSSALTITDELHKTSIQKYLELNKEHQANVRTLIDGYALDEQINQKRESNTEFANELA